IVVREVHLHCGGDLLVGEAKILPDQRFGAAHEDGGPDLVHDADAIRLKRGWMTHRKILKCPRSVADARRASTSQGKAHLLPGVPNLERYGLIDYELGRHPLKVQERVRISLRLPWPA